ncbi:MAG: cobalamin-binding protein [Oceanococcus sp.]
MRFSGLAHCLLIGVFCATSVQAEISVTDDLGRSVTLPQAAQRIVALAPHIVENLYAIGAGQKIIATVSWADYPELAKQIPRIGSYHSVSLEAVVAYKPDLVVLWASGNGEGLLQQLQDFGLKVYASESKSPADIGRTLRNLGALSGVEAQAHQRADAFEMQMSSLRQQYASKSEVSVFYQIWHEPLQTVNGTHLISAVIALCGGRNVFSDAAALAPRTSIEAVLSLDPQLIVSGQSAQEMQSFWRSWTSLQAVKNERLIAVNPDVMHRHTARIADGARALCAALDKAR